MQRERYRVDDRIPVSRLVEDVVQTFDLRLVLRENICPVSLGCRGCDVVGQHVELLVELGLRRRGKPNIGNGRTLLDVVSQLIQTARAHILEQDVAAGHHGVYL